MRLKKIILSLLSALFVGTTLGLPSAAQAQAPSEMPPLPIDTAVRIGKLPNGLTYFIRHNEEPKGRAEFYIAQKVGSMQEEDSQQGLAHFLEHIAFNGTKNFPGKGIINFLESIGASFGGEYQRLHQLRQDGLHPDEDPRPSSEHHRQLYPRPA